MIPPADEDAYASRVCDALSAWNQAIHDQFIAFKTAFQRTDSADDEKAAIVSFLASSGEHTQQVADEIDTIDPSAIHGGQEAQESIVGALRKNVAGFQAATAKVEALDSSDEASMAIGFLDVIRTMRSSDLNAPLRLGGFDDPTLDRAFKNAPSCATFF